MIATRKISLISLGCPKNLVDSEGIVSDFLSNSIEMVVDPAEADVVVVNTCGFLAGARQESIAAIRSAAELKKDGLKAVFVTGCMVGHYADEILSAVPEVDRLVDFADYGNLSTYVDEILPAPPASNPGFVQPGRYVQARLTPAHYAYLKISEGCNHTCSFCVIPRIRGRMKSISLEELVERARRLVRLGAKEINVVAQDSTQYGIDLYGRRRTADLLGALGEIDDLRWIRLLYAYPTEVDEALIERLASGGRVLPYLDVPLQHSSNAMLSRMRRQTKESDVEDILTKLRARAPGLVIRTTLIVGFPGETEADHEHMLDFIRRHEIERLGAFTYSPEKGSPAAELPDQIAPEVVAERLDAVMRTQQAIAAKKNAKLVGRTLEVLIEEPSEGGRPAVGRSWMDAPEIDGKVTVHGRAAHAGEMVDVRITDAEAYDLTGVIEEEAS